MEATNTKAKEQIEKEFKELKLSLPKAAWFENSAMVLYKSFWCPQYFLKGAITFQNYFEAQDGDIILASLPRTGTTWLKSLLYTIINRDNFSSQFSQHPFHTKNPHDLVLYLEGLDLSTIIVGNQPLPRLFATHLPYLSLSDSIKTSQCRIVYVCRNPLDTFVSLWHFYLQFERNKDIHPNMELMEEYIGKYCKGESPFGPYEDHLLGYWEESNRNPQKVLFLEYEGLKKEPKAHLKSLADFVGCPFSEEEEKQNVIDEIIKLCSLKSLKEMEVNKNGNFSPMVENKTFFRKGEVGDWTTHFTPSMAKQFHQMLRKLNKAGFSFTYYRMNL
ncbi:cytosolic sulfotransferase 13-like [Spinacia oleracea]|uniref:Sulfotransferase n=1 Tax=Spinacia oleracea TaxID=3562 RepID=A0A9R0J6B0_SPIOL|nr:cytosolic sulfotransferase 13-like [Spinacia oleracea]